MIRIIIVVLVAAVLYFAYTNFSSINKNVEKSVKSGSDQIKSEKIINTVDATRKNSIKESEGAVKNSF